MSVKAMWMMIQKIHAESHVSRLFILFDMVWCAVHYAWAIWNTGSLAGFISEEKNGKPL